ncbi:cytochrome b/b6 domain-containing protein [Halomonas sp. M1]|uniref:cytochrome b/b6 domain-containing protein n=1 Tax=Halomonas sp. M1 TaxID=3035470 RepID=UPI0024862A68|nr:cytochrome b/b6 domain-containing protein [Halomonas sp. M1]WFE71872.1 cytochrome b/b6 domain-containing protein [Halomonas sp. M1]
MLRNTQRVLVWDGLVRLFHWGLLVAVAFSYYTTKTDGAPFLFPIEVHAQAGYIIIGLLVFRVIWGFVGSFYARFSTFLYPPSKTAAYAKALLIRRASPYASHNPLGGWMVIVLLLSLAFQSVSGLFLSDDIFFQGPLYSLVGRDISREITSLHALNSDFLLMLIGLHVAALVAHKLLGEGLVSAMVTGAKRFQQPPVDLVSARIRVRRVQAGAALLIAVGVTGWLWFY